MALRLTWDDLLIRDLAPHEATRWISEWSWLISGKFYPVFMSKFGDWFLRRPDGTTDVLDVLEGSLTRISETPAEFDAMVNDQKWHEDRLLSWLIYQLHEEGKIAGKGQCYAFAPHPSLTGKIDLQSVMVMDIPVWQSICAQLFRGRDDGGGAK